MVETGLPQDARKRQQVTRKGIVSPAHPIAGNLDVTRYPGQMVRGLTFYQWSLRVA